MKNISRRNLLVWTAPVLTSVTLPTHAQTSNCEDLQLIIGQIDVAPPSGGDAIVTMIIRSDASFTLNAVDASSGSVETPSLPLKAEQIEIAWRGPAQIGTGVPLDSTNLIFSWQCGSSIDVTTTEIDLSAEIANATE